MIFHKYIIREIFDAENTCQSLFLNLRIILFSFDSVLEAYPTGLSSPLGYLSLANARNIVQQIKNRGVGYRGTLKKFSSHAPEICN